MPIIRLHERLLLLCVFVLAPLQLTAAAAGSTIGFGPAFTSAASPFAVVECDAACLSPGSVTLALKLVRAGDLSTTDTVYISTRAPLGDTLHAATALDDYTPLTALPVVFAPSETTKTVPLTIISDGVYEEDEYLEAFLSDGSAGVTIRADASVAYIVIQDGGDGISFQLTLPNLMCGFVTQAGFFSFSTSTYTFAESAGDVSVPIVRTGGASGAVTLRYRLTNPTQATAVNDKSFRLGDSTYEVQFDEGQRVGAIPITIIDDAVYEARELFFLEIASLSPTKERDATTSVAKIGMPRIAIIYIADDGDAGVFSFATPSIFCREDVGSALLTVLRTRGTSSSSYMPVNLVITTLGAASGSNATEGGSLAFDYLAKSEKLTWANGEAKKTFAVKIFNNNRYEAQTRAVKVRMVSVEGGASIGTQLEAWIYIIDDRDAGTLSFSRPQYDVLESGGSVTLDIQRTGVLDSTGVNTYTSGIVTVEVATYDGMILPGLDRYDIAYDYDVVKRRGCTHTSPCTAPARTAYTPIQAMTLTFAQGESLKQVTIAIHDDDLFQAPDRVFKVTLQKATGGAHIGVDYEHPSEWFGYRSAFLALESKSAVLLDNVGAIVSINDDGDAAVLVSKASLSTSKIGQHDRFEIWLNAVPTADVAVALAFDAALLRLSVTSLTFTPTNWSEKQSVRVAAVPNSKSEGVRKVYITLSCTSADATYASLFRTAAQASGSVLGIDVHTQKRGVYETGDSEHEFLSSDVDAPQPTGRVTVSIFGNYHTGVAITPESVRHRSSGVHAPATSVSVRKGGHSATVDLSLTSEPAADVRITLVPDVVAGIAVEPSSVVISASRWNVPVHVKVVAIAVVGAPEPQAVQFSSVSVSTSSTGDPRYNQGSAPSRRIFVQRFPSALILLDASTASIREGAGDDEKVIYSIVLGSEPMHWEPSGRDYVPLELVLKAEADTTLYFPPRTDATTFGKATTITVACNSSLSTATRKRKCLGVLRFQVHPDIDRRTGSNQVGAARLRLFRVAGGENGGLGGIRVGVSIANVDTSNDWDESGLQSQCSDTLENKGACSVLNAGTPIPSFFPLDSTIYTMDSQFESDADVSPSGMFSDASNTYIDSTGWLDIDVTFAVNKLLARVPRSASAKAITFLVHSWSTATFTQDGVDEVVFASREHADSTLQPQLRLIGSGVVNLALLVQASQSCPGNAKAAIDGQTISKLSTSASYALSATPYAYPWWQTDLTAIRALERITITVKKKLSTVSMDESHLVTSFWVFLSTSSLAQNNDALAGFTYAKAHALYAKQFHVTTRSIAASDADTITFQWHVNGERHGVFGIDRFVGDYATPVEARYVLVQVESENNNIALNEVEIYQLAFASVRVSIGGFMPSLAQARLGKNQLQFLQPEQLSEADSPVCDARTDICRHELVFSSGNWQTPQRVGVRAIDDLVAMGDHDIYATHTPESNDPDFDERARCGAPVAASDSIACKDAVFVASSVKPIRVLEDDENKILLSTQALEIVEGSQNFTNAPVFVQPATVMPPYVRCSTSQDLITLDKTTPARDCAVSFDPASTARFEMCIANENALPLSIGSAWMMAGFASDTLNISRIDLRVPPMLGSKYAKRISVWWSASKSLLSSDSDLLDLTSGWEKLQSIDVDLTSNGTQYFAIDDLELVSVQAILIALEQSYDDSTQCMDVPMVTITGSEPMPFPLPIRGDLSHPDSVPPSLSHLSRMHLIGKRQTVHVRLTSEPFGDVVVAAVLEDAGGAVVVYDAANQSSVPESVQSLVGATYESGDTRTFTFATAIKFTPTNWNVPQALTYMAVDDNVFHGNRTFVVTHAATTSTDTSAPVVPYQCLEDSNFLKVLEAIGTALSYSSAAFIVSDHRASTWPYRFDPAWSSASGALDVTVVDDDLPGVTVSASIVRVPESGPSGNFSVFLDSAPTHNVIVAVTHNAPASLLTVDPLQLEFTSTNWYVPQLVAIHATANDIYDGEQPFTIDYDRLVAKAPKPELALSVTSADASYNNILVGGNEFDRSMRYVVRQSVQAIVLDNDTGCFGEYACQNGGVCVSSASGNQCACRARFGMRDCSALCESERECEFNRIAFRLQCQPQTENAICSRTFSASKFVSTLYRLLANSEFTAANGKVFLKLQLAPMSQLLYVVNSTCVDCGESSSDASGCVAVLLDLNASSSVGESDSSAVLQKLNGFLSTGSLKTGPIFAELMTLEPQYPFDFSSTIAVWIFIGFCVLCVAAVGAVFTTRLVRAKSSHVTPQLDCDDVVASPPRAAPAGAPTAAAAHAPDQPITSPRST